MYQEMFMVALCDLSTSGEQVISWWVARGGHALGWCGSPGRKQWSLVVLSADGHPAAARVGPHVPATVPMVASAYLCWV